jgi:hypothetical protein
MRAVIDDSGSRSGSVILVGVAFAVLTSDHQTLIVTRQALQSLGAKSST